jgi:hypothetical protein
MLSLLGSDAPPKLKLLDVTHRLARSIQVTVLVAKPLDRGRNFVCQLVGQLLYCSFLPPKSKVEKRRGEDRH